MTTLEDTRNELADLRESLTLQLVAALDEVTAALLSIVGTDESWEEE